ncbi:glycoside hydrolase domain-containing protein [uncultured Agrococcus sp.]|uniref:glycoside hydrolase domain-containing protein n=1 Tax=uncultured Agrococcus sp. TaxID=382258 RepID=UPI0025DE601A|nr:glycoside hydrolase domain-containing protein [uncultured Agrococcus sp.]
MDDWILLMQSWLDQEYGGRSGYTPTPGDGRTGWRTMYSMTRALQIELGIGAPSDAFGPTTRSQFNTQIGTIGSATGQSHQKVIGILRMALWCKGYFSGYIEPNHPHFFQYTDGLENAIREIRTNLGLPAFGGTTVKIMASLLTMDAYTLLSGGSAAVRGVQQFLNGRYVTRADFPLIPCDGVFTRQVQVGLMFAVQYEIGMADGVANGNFGPGTQQGLRTHGGVGLGSSDGARRLVSIFQAALILNGHTSTPLSGTFDSSTQSQMQAFQQFVALPTSAGANYATWASLLVSTGDPDRPVTGADTATQINDARAVTLYNHGHRVVGRYINGTTKRLTHNEPAILQNRSLRWFPIYQEWNNSASWFSPALGRWQGIRIAARARALGVPGNTIVFLAVDYDPIDDEISALIIPHFHAAKAAIQASSTHNVRLGVYGTRNVCARLAAAGITDGSFVADMSTGWSGNLGFRLPQDWMYDQIKTTTIGSGAGLIEIDRVAVSQSATSLNNSELIRTPRKYNGSSVAGYDEEIWWKFAELGYLAERTATSVPMAADFVLYEIHRKLYGLGHGNGLQDNAWEFFFAPPPFQFHPDARLEQFQSDVEAFYGGVPSGGPFGFTTGTQIYAVGDLPHCAAVARAHLQLGIPGSNVGLADVDFASWAGDLRTAWADYEVQRLQGGITDAYTFLRAAIGGRGSAAGQFGEADLRADALGYIIAQELFQGPPIALDRIIREILLNTADDPAWIIKQFSQRRFGNSRANLENAGRLACTGNIPVVEQALATLYGGQRRPGQTRSASTDPPASVIATEIDAVGRAFADAVFDAQSSWSQRS